MPKYEVKATLRRTGVFIVEAPTRKEAYAALKDPNRKPDRFDDDWSVLMALGGAKEIKEEPEEDW